GEGSERSLRHAKLRHPRDDIVERGQAADLAKLRIRGFRWMTPESASGSRTAGRTEGEFHLAESRFGDRTDRGVNVLRRGGGLARCDQAPKAPPVQPVVRYIARDRRQPLR